MKKIFLPLFLLVALSAFSQPGKQYPKKESRKAFYESLSRKYSSAPVREILGKDTKDEFESYVDGHSELDLVNSYSTVIHELLHGYNTSENGGYYYFVEPGRRIFVSEGKYYNSSELNKYVRKGLQDSVFRYALYIGATQALPPGSGGKGRIAEEGVSVARGIYGLLEEFNAYYFGTRAIYELHEYYDDNYGESNPDAWKDYRHEVSSDVLAWYEFRLFFAWYMSYAKQKHPDVYEDIHSNKPLRVVFTLLEGKYHRLADSVEQQLVDVNRRIGPDMMESLDFSGSEEDFFRFLEVAGMDPVTIYREETTVVSGQTVRVKKSVLDRASEAELKEEYNEVVREVKQATGSGLTLYFAQCGQPIAYLKRQSTPQVLEEFEKLKIKGLTEDNYEEYLK